MIKYSKLKILPLVSYLNKLKYYPPCNYLGVNYDYINKYWWNINILIHSLLCLFNILEKEMNWMKIFIFLLGNDWHNPNNTFDNDISLVSTKLKWFIIFQCYSFLKHVWMELNCLDLNPIWLPFVLKSRWNYNYLGLLPC